MDIYNFLRALILPLEEIDSSLPKKGRIVDLGCGEGVITRFIAKNKNRQVIGVDLDKKRLKNSQLKNLKFKLADIRDYNLKNVDGVILSDVVHHINSNDQDKVLLNIAKGLKKGGILVIKEIDTKEFIRSLLSRFWDFLFYPSEKIYYSNYQKLSQKLEDLGFRVSIKRPTRLFPGSTTLFICKKE